jgi:alpha,alpha-trehalose-phosphate synthase [UDP-forming]
VNTRHRLVVVSNRLPVTMHVRDGRHVLQSSGGGLVSALVPVLGRTGGSWIGWTGTDYDRAVAKSVRQWCSGKNYSFAPVFLTADERALYYRGFSNEIVWPLCHGLPSRCQFTSSYWNAYRNVNDKFAEVVQRNAHSDDLIWIHDYHLMLLAQALRGRRLRNQLAYFHHIPFPCPDVFETLPWRVDVLRALMRFNVVGFQTIRDRNNFISCLERCLTDVRVSGNDENLQVEADGYRATVGAYPISIDYDAFAAEAPTTVETPPGENSLKILGIDRLDYTKGIPERIIAFKTLLDQNPELRGKVTMVQIVVPSREDIPEYRDLRLRIETLVSHINGDYSTTAWIPIHYFYRAFSRTELIGFYRAAHVAAVTPLRDGMNLVAKEFCASRMDQRGVLVLSEFAGAAEELKCGALLVNPYDSEALASAFERAIQMNDAEQHARMDRMQSHLRAHDVFRWCESFNVGFPAPLDERLTPSVVGMSRSRSPAIAVVGI